MAPDAGRRSLALHLGAIALLFLLQYLLPDYDRTNMTRIMLLAAYAMGYNLLLGYTGLMSLGHAMFFAAGLYGAGLTVQLLGAGPGAGFLAGLLAAAALSIVIGLVALRTAGVSFMIVTLMFSQACYLLILYFNGVTRGDEGFVLAQGTQILSLAGLSLDLTRPTVRYDAALLLFALALLGCLALVRSGTGRVLVAIRENEERTALLGYPVFRYKLLALVLSGTLSGAAGAAYALLFSYVGATFASIQYSILPLLWVLLGGQGTTLGPLVGTALMFYAVDKSSELTSSYMLVVGLALILLVLWFPRGLLGSLRQRWVGWLP